MKKIFILVYVLLLSIVATAQWDFPYNYSSAGTRVALVEAKVSVSTPSITIFFIDSSYNSSNTFEVYRRPLHGNGTDWVLQSSFAAGTGHWVDLNVTVGDVWEYQVKRDMGTKFATGYVAAGIDYDQTDYKGRMIVLIDSTMQTPLAVELTQLKKDLTGEGWFVEEIYTARAAGWYSADTVIQVKQQIQNVWNAAPLNDKPSHLFIIGHVPVARSGLDLQAADGHVNSNGAVGSDTYYADLDGVFTDDSTYTPAFVLYDPNAYNIPNDFKWDQDIIPSELELAFGRIDFFDIGSYADTEVQLLKNYLNRLHDYRHVNTDMGERTAFRLGYANSYDGSYRSLIPISGADSVAFETSASTNHPIWVKNNGPFQAYLQSSQAPSLSQWDADGMDATIYGSDQSFWGQWSMPETGSAFAKIRALLAADTKCLVTLWQSSAINVFYQPGIGETFGMSCKRIMDHNITNNIIEKPSQPYDSPDFWNRTHMQYHGDPSLRLFQVHPITNLTESPINSTQLELNWTASIESNIIGYNIFKSTTEFGQFVKVNSSLVVGTSYTDVTFTNSTDWYMIKTVKHQTTGSGTYLNPSIGVSIQASTASTIFEVVVEACDSFIWLDTVTYYASTDTPTFTYPNDSTISIDLTINQSTISTDVISVCDSYIWIDGITYVSNNNSATHTLTNTNNCDSLITLDLTINQSTNFTDVISACNSYTWIDGITYSANNNTAIHTILNSNNCDSVITLNLTINQSTNFTDVISACNSHTWLNGITYIANNNTATHTIPNSNNCDSVITLNLTIIESTGSTDTIIACDTHTWLDGITYTTSNNTATVVFTNSINCDSIVTLDLTINLSSNITDVIYACNSHTWMDGITYTSNNNTATHILTNSNNCDLTVLLDLTVTSIDASITQTGATISANASGLSYQWINCANNMNIEGETNQTFVSESNGNFAVVITKDSCSITSECKQVTGVDIIDFELSEDLIVFPNPTTGVIYIDAKNVNAIEIYNIEGQLILTNINNNLIDLSTQTKGIYFVKIINSTSTIINKIVLE